MGLPIPRLAEAMQKMDSVTEQLHELVAITNKIAVLLEEQNEILRNN